MSDTIIMITFIYVLIAFYTDIRWSIIPNKLVVPATGLGIGVQTFLYQWDGFIHALLGISVTFMLTFILYLIKAIGAGDVKGLAALGAITGAKFALFVLFIALLYAAAVGLFIILIRGKVGSTIRHWYMSILCYYSSGEKKHLRLIATHRVHSFPFMIAVLPAVITWIVIKDASWY